MTKANGYLSYRERAEAFEALRAQWGGRGDIIEIKSPDLLGGEGGKNYGLFLVLANNLDHLRVFSLKRGKDEYITWECLSNSEFEYIVRIICSPDC